MNHLDKIIISYYGLDYKKCKIIRRDYESVIVKVDNKEIALRRQKT